MKGCQTLQPAAQVREPDPALAWRTNGTHDQVVPGLDDLVAEDEEAAFPALVSRDAIQVVDADQLPRCEPFQQRRPCCGEIGQRKVSGTIHETLAGCLQQVRFPGRRRAPDPCTLTGRRTRQGPQVVDNRLVPGGKKRIEDGVIIKPQRQSELAQDDSPPAASE